MIYNSNEFFYTKRFYYNLVESNVCVLGWTNTTDRLTYIQGKMHDQLNSWEHNKHKLREWETLNLTVTLEIWLSLSFHHTCSVPLFTICFDFFNKCLEKFQLWAGSIWNKLVSTLVHIDFMKISMNGRSRRP